MDYDHFGECLVTGGGTVVGVIVAGPTSFEFARQFAWNVTQFSFETCPNLSCSGGLTVDPLILEVIR